MTIKLLSTKNSTSKLGTLLPSLRRPMTDGGRVPSLMIRDEYQAEQSSRVTLFACSETQIGVVLEHCFYLYHLWGAGVYDLRDQKSRRFGYLTDMQPFYICRICSFFFYDTSFTALTIVQVEGGIFRVALNLTTSVFIYSYIDYISMAML